MKTYHLLLVCSLAIVFFGCDTSKDKQINNLKQQVSTLSKQKNTIEQEKNIFVNQVTESNALIKEIQNRLRKIRINKDRIIIRTHEEIPDTQDIFTEISQMEQALNNEQALISDLKKKLQESSINIAHLEDIINNLTQQITDYEQEIIALKIQLAEKEKELQQSKETLIITENELNQTQQNLETAKQEMQTGYLIIDEENNLIRKKIIQKKGGFLGLGKTLALSSNLDTPQFKKIDITKHTIISIPSDTKEIKIIPDRNKETYEIEIHKDKITGIYIVDAEEFWKIRYAAIIIKK